MQEHFYSNTKKKHFLLALTGVAIGFLMVYWIFQSYIDGQQKILQQKVELTGQFTAQNLERAVRDDINTLENLRGRIEITNGAYFENWEYDADLMLRQHPSFRFVEWIDSNMIVRRIHPLQGNEAALNLDISTKAYRKDEWIEHSLDSIINITPWVNLEQGGHAFLVDAPVYYKGRFQGSITAGLDFSPHFDRLLAGMKGYAMEIEDGNGRIFYTYGNPQPVVSGEKYVYESTVEIDPQDLQVWTFRFMAVPGLINNQSSSKARLGLSLGTLVCILMGVVLYYFLQFKYESKKMKEANRELVALNNAFDGERKKAEEASRSKTDFLSTMSHEIRTPLNAILGFIEILRTSNLPEEETRHLEMMNLSSKNLLALVNDILEIDKIEAGKLVFRNEAFSPAAELQNLVDLFKPGFEEKQLYLKHNLKNVKGYHVLADSGKFTQVCTNLIRNAYKFTSEGGVEINLEEHLNDGEVLLKVSVSDTGIGIPEDKIDSIFERFSQVDSGIRRKHEGTGLGLAITTQLLELMGGRIRVSSKEGKGTTFVAEMKFRHACAIEGSSGENENGDVTFPDARILIAEDNAMNVAILRQILQQMEINCEVAENGLEALDLLERSSYDLVLMDVHMPEMDGFTATRMLRQKGGDVPVIGLSANVTREALEEAREAGMQDYITKPFSRKRLVEILNVYLS